MITYFQVIDWQALRQFFCVHRNLDYLIRFYQTTYELVIEHRPDRIIQAFLVSSFYTITILHLLWLWLAPPDDLYWTVARYDFFILLGIPTFFKLLFALGTSVTFYLNYRLYFTTTNLQIAKETKLVLTQSERSLFLDNSTRIFKIVLIISNTIHICVYVLILWTFTSLVVVAPLYSPYLFPLTWLTLPNLLSFAFCFLLIQASLCLFIHVCKLAAALCILVTLMMFNQFRSVERVLWKRCLTLGQIKHFILSHHNLVANVFELNLVYGPLFLTFMAGFLPANITMNAALMLGIVSPFIRYIFLQFIVGFFFVFIGIHFMTTGYTHRIFRPYKRVASLFARFNHKYRMWCSLSQRWKIASRIEAFYTRNPYGITYGLV